METFEIVIWRQVIVNKYDTYKVIADTYEDAVKSSKKAWELGAFGDDGEWDDDVQTLDNFDIQYDNVEYEGDTLIEPSNASTKSINIEQDDEFNEIKNNLPISVQRDIKIDKILNDN